MMKIFETHAHYDDEAFREDREALFDEMFANDIDTIINVGASFAGCEQSVALADSHEKIYAAVGIHPEDVEELTEARMAWLKKTASENEKVLAIGEIGLDYHYPEPAKEIQQQWFRRQLRLAADIKKPVIIHSREACQDTLACMRAEHAEQIGGVIHCYSYSKEAAQEFLKMGFYFGFGGVVTFKNAKKAVEAVEAIPIEKILLETDCPYMAPEPNRGKRNYSGYLPYVAERIAQIKQMTAQEVIDITNANARKLFGLSAAQDKERKCSMAEKDYKNVMHLGNPTNTIAVLNRYGFSFQKKFGQNFLIDENVVEKIVRDAGVTKDDFVLEIGPGIGTMTQILCENAREVVAVEIDDKLIPILTEDTLSWYDNVTVIHEDILKLDIVKLANERNGGKPIKVVANLPYYITTPIIMGLFESHVPLDSITIMVQKEVADRMQVGPGTKDYGALSLAVQYYAKPQILLNVPASCFMPRPNVDSAVIQLTRYEKPPVEVADEHLMFRLIRASFNQRRKTMTNSVGNSPELSVSKEQMAAALEKCGLSATVRGEALTLAQFAELANVLSEDTGK